MAVNRPYVSRGQAIAGVYQRCTPACPTDECQAHRWAYTLELPAGEDGRRRQLAKSGFTTGRAAMLARQALISKYRAGELANDRNKTVAGWLTEWVEAKIARDEIEPSTARGYRDVIRLHLVPEIGHHRLAALRGIDVTRAYKRIQERRADEIAAANATNQADDRRRVPVPRPISAASISRVHAVLSGALKSATKAGLVSRNIAPDVELPRAERRKVTPPTPKAYGAFLDAVEGERMYPLFVLAGHSGLRRGELVGLRWSDVDLTTGRIVVRTQRVSVGYQVHEAEPKTDAGTDRTVYVDADTCDVLRAWRKVQAAEQLAWGSAYQATGLVFTREDGAAWHPDRVTKVFARLAKAAGLPTSKLHSMRHFRAAALISTGADIAAVSKSLGHANIAVTSDLYGSLFDKANREMSEKAAGLVPRRRNASTA
jgi:integrase